MPNEVKNISRRSFVRCWTVGRVTESGTARRVSPICFTYEKASSYLQAWKNKNPDRDFRIFVTTGWQEEK